MFEINAQDPRLEIRRRIRRPNVRSENQEAEQ